MLVLLLALNIVYWSKQLKLNVVGVRNLMDFMCQITDLKVIRSH